MNASLGQTRDVVVLGAGASGLLCALAAAGRGRRVLVVDHNDAVGRKVRISGGGRCNFTNRRVAAEDYVCPNPHFVKSALARFGPADFCAFLERNGLSGVEADAGKLFCRQGAPALAEVLVRETRALGVEFLLSTPIHSAAKEAEVFRVETGAGALRCASLVLALGGPAWPAIGATSLGAELARGFGLAVTPFWPGLVPLLAPPDRAALCRSLSGVSLPVRVRAGGASLAGQLLFTHRGLSGPAALDASLHVRPGEAMEVDFLPGLDPARILADSPRAAVKTSLGRLVPRRLAAALCEAEGIAGTPAALPKKRLEAFLGLLAAWPFVPAGDEGFARAETTRGGVDVAGVSSKTMEAREVPGLYVTGELLDVAGRLGGFNLQWAWSSGFAAGSFA